MQHHMLPECIAAFVFCVSVQGLHPLKDSAFVVFEGESFFFFRCAKNPGICEVTKDRSGASSRNREKKEHLRSLQTGQLHAAL